MIVIFAVLFGLVMGVRSARRQKNAVLADYLQYAFVYALVSGLVGLMITIIIHRNAI